MDCYFKKLEKDLTIREKVLILIFTILVIFTFYYGFLQKIYAHDESNIEDDSIYWEKPEDRIIQQLKPKWTLSQKKEWDDYTQLVFKGEGNFQIPKEIKELYIKEIQLTMGEPWKLTILLTKDFESLEKEKIEISNKKENFEKMDVSEKTKTPLPTSEKEIEGKSIANNTLPKNKIKQEGNKSTVTEITPPKNEAKREKVTKNSPIKKKQTVNEEKKQVTVVDSNTSTSLTHGDTEFVEDNLVQERIPMSLPLHHRTIEISLRELEPITSVVKGNVISTFLENDVYRINYFIEDEEWIPKIETKFHIGLPYHLIEIPIESSEKINLSGTFLSLEGEEYLKDGIFQDDKFTLEGKDGDILIGLSFYMPNQNAGQISIGLLEILDE
ncbi:MAG: hypothetical protein Q4Q07_04620 [Tissierellia bacterium]|nr:hypothetical protein [Tissierellia bacterium]